jgi:hypothetical protein
MKKYLVVVFGFVMGGYAHSQVTCIFCYDQNAPISTPITNLILNGGFENNNCIPNTPFSSFCPNSQWYSCDIANWTCTHGGFATYACMFNSTMNVIVEGTQSAYFGNSNCSACGGNDTSCINNTGCIVTGIPIGYPSNTSAYGGDTGVSLQQTVTGLVVGNIYVLEFWAGGEGNFVGRGLFAVDVGFGNIMMREKPTPAIVGIGTRNIIEFIATSSSHTIKFTNWGHIMYNQSCTELVIDDVRLYILKELSSIVPPCIITGTNVSDENSSATIYPNPVTDKLNITLTTNESSQIILYDIASRKLLQQSFINSVSLNTTQLEKGIYFYEVRSGNKIIRNGKVVKE